MVSLHSTFRLLLCGSLVLLGACTSHPPSVPVSSTLKESAVYPGHYKIGSPYKVDNTWYYPKADPSYVEEGMASWYGPGFHGNRTANGDLYDQTTFTAAHRTLPLPSMVRITNLANGRSVIAMVNDRGPFSKKRIIDISEKTAIALHMKQQGVGRVRVEFLPEQTEEMLAALHLPPIEGQYATAASEYKEPNMSSSGSPLVASAIAAEPIAIDGASNPIFIQAGAYSSKGSAEKVAHSLKKFGKVGVKTVKLEEKTFYRVRIGPLKNARYANQLLDKVIGLGNPHAIIIGNSG